MIDGSTGNVRVMNENAANARKICLNTG